MPDRDESMLLMRSREVSRRVVPMALCALFSGATLMAGPVVAADVGGFYADQQKARAVAAEKDVNKDAEPNCPQVISRATTDPSALAAYRAGLCYLQADQPDMLAAKAWLSRASDLGFMPAHRLLRSVLAAEAGPHGGAPHCHPLGEGQQLCHGGAPPLAAAQPR